MYCVCIILYVYIDFLLSVAGNLGDTGGLELVEVYFGTPTYDIVVKDQKDTLEMKLSAIGGNMGLLTGFSFISAVEIVFFGLKFLRSLKLNPLI